MYSMKTYVSVQGFTSTAWQFIQVSRTMFAYKKLTQMDGNNETQLIDLIYDLSTKS